MTELTLDVARKILDAALAKAVEKKIKPLVITVLDARGAVKVTAAQDGTSLMRAEIAHGKAYGALALGMGSRALFQRAQEQAYFVGAVNSLAQGRLVPVPGGVLIQNGGTLLGAVGLRRLAKVNHANAVQLAERLSRIQSVEIVNTHFFNEFVMRTPRPAAELIEALARRGVIGGLPVSRLLPGAGLDDCIIVASTETNTEDDREAYVQALADCLR